MKKLLCIALSLYACTIQAEVETEITRKPISFYYYSSVTPKSLMDEEGKEFKNSGRYTLTENTAIKAKPVNKTIMVGGIERNDGVIQITENNVTIDLNGKYIAGSVENDRPTAIYVADGVSNVTIRNGSIYGGSSTKGFETGIHVGQNVSNLTIENMMIRGCLGPNGAIKLEGGHNNELYGVTLKNITTYDCKHNNNLYVINASYVHNLMLDNVKCQKNKTITTGTLTVIKLNNCQEVSLKQVEISNNSGSNTTTCLELNACVDVNIENSEIVNNRSIKSDTTCMGIKIDDSDDVEIKQVSLSGISNAAHVIWAHRSKNLLLQNISITACAHGSDSLSAITLKGTQDALIEHISINKQISSVDFHGITAEDTEDGINCKNIRCNNIKIDQNTASSGNLNGIIIKGTQSAILSRCTIENNKLTTQKTGNINGICIAPHTKNSKDVTIKNCQIINNRSESKEVDAGKHIAGVYLKNVQECTISETDVLSNSGNGQIFGFYAERTPSLSMEDCIAKYNHAGIFESGATGGLDKAPSAGLYLWISNNASVKNCQFLETKSGNRNNGDSQLSVAGGTSTQLIDVTASCGGHGIVNAGISPSSPNTNNTFIDCICQENGTRITTLAANNETETVAPQYQGSGENRYCWQSEATASGATEQNTKDSSYIRCKFIQNGHNKHVISYGLCMANDGTTSICKNIEVINCESRDNGFYGFYNTQKTTAAAHLIGCLSITNGAFNEIAEHVEPDDHCRNFRTVESDTIPCLKIVAIDRVLIDPDKIDLVNFSVAA